jgi:Cu/Ag efflux protein CusF
MKLMLTTAAALALLTATSPLIARGDQDSAQSPGFKSEKTVTMKATVQDIDRENRKVTLKGQDGTTETIKCPLTVRNLDQLKKGDVVTAKFTESMAIAVRKSNEPPSATGRESLSRAPLGEKPSAVKASTMQINATIEKINRDERELTLLGPDGNTKLVKVPEDVKRFDELKEGDQVIINATQSIAIDVSPPEKPS